MKYIIWLCFIASLTSILLGFFLDVHFTEKLKGFGTLGLFFITIPLFIYHSWKGKDPKDYMLTNDSLKKMQKHKEEAKKNNERTLF